MTTIDRKLYGFEIEGFGDGYLHALGDAIRISTETLQDGLLNVRYVEGLGDWPQKINTTTDVLRGHTTISTMDIIIDGIDLADIEATRYSNLLLQFFWRSRVNPLGFIQSAMGAGDAFFNLEMIVGEALPVPGDILYIGREALYVTNVGGSSTTALIDVTRGVLGTDAEAHTLDDGEVFAQNPLRIDRRVTLYEYDLDAETETARWRGVVESLDLKDETSRLVISCLDLMGVLSKRKVGEDRWEGKASLSRTIVNGSPEPVLWGRTFDAGSQAFEYIPQFPGMPDGFLPGTTRYAALGFSAKGVALEIEGVAVAMRVGGARTIPGIVGLYGWSHEASGGVEISGDRVDAEPAAKELRAVEILVFDADSPLCYFKDADENPSDHPAIVALNILMSTGGATWSGTTHTKGPNGDYDWLPQPWGRGLPASWVDVASFERLTQGWPLEGLRARAGYLGGGDLVSFTDCLAELLQSMGAYLYVNATAQISARRLADPGQGLTDHTINAELLSGSGNEGDAQGFQIIKPVAEIKLKVAQKGPGGKEGDGLSNQIIGQRTLTRYRFHAVTDTLTSTLIYGDPVTHDLNNDEIERLGTLFASRYRYTQDWLPRYRIMTAPGSPVVAAGEWIRLDHPYLFNGELVRGLVGARCLVLEGNWSPSDGRCELIVVDWSPASRAVTLLTPAWKVESVTDGNNFKVHKDWYSDDDPSFFRTGSLAWVELWAANGVKRSTNQAYALSIDADGVIVMNVQFEDGGGGITPADGDVIRIPPADASDIDSWEYMPMTYLGDSTGAVGGGGGPGRWDL